MLRSICPKFKKKNEKKQDAFKSVLLQKFSLRQKAVLVPLSWASKQDLNKLFPSDARVFERQSSSTYTDTSCTYSGDIDNSWYLRKCYCHAKREKINGH